jgi:hypothetical protein
LIANLIRALELLEIEQFEQSFARRIARASQAARIRVIENCAFGAF